MWNTCRYVEPFDNSISLSSVETSVQGWHMMTVEEEVARAVQIASASSAQEADNRRITSRTVSVPQKVTSSVEEVTSISSSNAEEVTNRSASRTDSPSSSPSPVTESPGSVTVKRSPGDKCGKSFSNKAKLHFHTKIIHRGERLPCKVAHCEKTDDVFPHKEVSKVECDECGKSFTDKKRMHWHKKIIHRGERLLCKVVDCEKTFRGYNTRENHMRMVHGSPMLRCKFEGCTSEFYSREGLRRHHGNHEV